MRGMFILTRATDMLQTLQLVIQKNSKNQLSSQFRIVTLPKNVFVGDEKIASNSEFFKRWRHLCSSFQRKILRVIRAKPRA